MEGGEEGKLGIVEINEERKQVLSRENDVEEMGTYGKESGNERNEKFT